MTLVLGVINGEPILCCWDDCEIYGHDEYKVVVKKTAADRGVHYVFCGPFHKELFVNSHRDYGNVRR